MSSGQIADLLERLAGANHALAAELDAIAASRRSLSQSTVDRLEHLVEQMRPAAQIRQVLADLDPRGTAGRCAGMAPTTAGRVRQHRCGPSMSRQMAQIGLPGQRLDILSGGDVDRATGRLLSVAELQQALRFALTLTRTPPEENQGPLDPGRAGACPAQEPSAARADHSESRDRSSIPGPALPVPDEVVGGGSVQWGASPVPVGSGIGERPVAVTRPVAPSSAAVAPGFFRFPLADLLRRRPRDRDRAVTQVLADRWPGHRRVVFASLTGGAGRSTAAALMCAAAVDAGGPVLLLDATGEAGSDLATRVGGAGTRRDWTRLTGAEAEMDFAALRRRRGGGDTDGAVCVVAIGGDAGSPPPAEAVAAGAAAAARSWPLVLVDIPHGRSAVRAAVRAGRVDLLVMVCRGDPAEIADSGEFLRDLTAERRSGLRAAGAGRRPRGSPWPARRGAACAGRGVRHGGRAVDPRPCREADRSPQHRAGTGSGSGRSSVGGCGRCHSHQ